MVICGMFRVWDFINLDFNSDLDSSTIFPLACVKSSLVPPESTDIDSGGYQNWCIHRYWGHLTHRIPTGGSYLTKYEAFEGNGWDFQANEVKTYAHNTFQLIWRIWCKSMYNQTKNPFKFQVVRQQNKNNSKWIRLQPTEHLKTLVDLFFYFCKVNSTSC